MRQDLVDIIEHNLHAGIHLCNQEDGTSGIGRAIMDFIDWFSNNELGKRWVLCIVKQFNTVDTECLTVMYKKYVRCNFKPVDHYIHFLMPL